MKFHTYDFLTSGETKRSTRTRFQITQRSIHVNKINHSAATFHTKLKSNHFTLDARCLETKHATSRNVLWFLFKQPLRSTICRWRFFSTSQFFQHQTRIHLKLSSQSSRQVSSMTRINAIAQNYNIRILGLSNNF